jgi:hypothetical protein
MRCNLKKNSLKGFLKVFACRINILSLLGSFFLLPGYDAEALPELIKEKWKERDASKVNDNASSEAEKKSKKFEVLPVRLITRNLHRNSFVVNDYTVHVTKRQVSDSNKKDIKNNRSENLLIQGKLYKTEAMPLDSKKLYSSKNYLNNYLVPAGNFYFSATRLRSLTKKEFRYTGVNIVVDDPKNQYTVERNQARALSAVKRSLDQKTNYCGSSMAIETPHANSSLHYQDGGQNVVNKKFEISDQHVQDQVSSTNDSSQIRAVTSNNFQVSDTPKEPVTIDALFLYTTKARSEAGGASAIRSEINNAIASTHQGLIDSGLGNIKINPIEYIESNYPESSNTMEQWLDEMKISTSVYAQNIRTLRDASKADLVVLIFDSFNPYCGLTNQLWGDHIQDSGGCYYYPTTKPGCGSAKDRAYIAISRNCFSYYSLLHEIGHQFGAHHHFDEVPVSDGIRYCGLFNDSCGHSFTTSNGNSYRTLMATANIFGDRINAFSNPIVTFQQSTIGIQNQRDNSKAILFGSRFVADYYKNNVSTPVPSLPPPSPTVSVSPSPQPSPTSSQTGIATTVPSGTVSIQPTQIQTAGALTPTTIPTATQVVTASLSPTLSSSANTPIPTISPSSTVLNSASPSSISVTPISTISISPGVSSETIKSNKDDPTALPPGIKITVTQSPLTETQEQVTPLRTQIPFKAPEATLPVKAESTIPSGVPNSTDTSLVRAVSSSARLVKGRCILSGSVKGKNLSVRSVSILSIDRKRNKTLVGGARLNRKFEYRYTVPKKNQKSNMRYFALADLVESRRVVCGR